MNEAQISMKAALNSLGYALGHRDDIEIQRLGHQDAEEDSADETMNLNDGKSISEQSEGGKKLSYTAILDALKRPKRHIDMNDKLTWNHCRKGKQALKLEIYLKKSYAKVAQFVEK